MRSFTHSSRVHTSYSVEQHNSLTTWAIIQSLPGGEECNACRDRQAVDDVCESCHRLERQGEEL